MLPHRMAASAKALVDDGATRVACRIPMLWVLLATEQRASRTKYATGGWPCLDTSRDTTIGPINMTI